MSSLLEDLDDLMMPYKCTFDKALVPEDWHTWYEWMNDRYGPGGWSIMKNVVCFKREQDLILFKLRWS